MNDQEKRIKLAEAMGLRVEERDRVYPPESSMVNGRYCYLPHDSLGRLLPDPFTDANDCNALIKHLNGLDCEVTVSWGPNNRVGPEYRVDVFLDDKHCHRHSYHGPDWMKGVCDLALKVIE